MERLGTPLPINDSLKESHISWHKDWPERKSIIYSRIVDTANKQMVALSWSITVRPENPNDNYRCGFHILVDGNATGTKYNTADKAIDKGTLHTFIGSELIDVSNLSYPQIEISFYDFDNGSHQISFIVTEGSKVNID